MVDGRVSGLPTLNVKAPKNRFLIVPTKWTCPRKTKTNKGAARVGKIALILGSLATIYSMRRVFGAENSTEQHLGSACPDFPWVSYGRYIIKYGAKFI